MTFVTRTVPALRFAITRTVGLGAAQVTTICEATGDGATTDAVNDMYAQLLRDERAVEIEDHIPEAPDV